MTFKFQIDPKNNFQYEILKEKAPKRYENSPDVLGKLYKTLEGCKSAKGVKTIKNCVQKFGLFEF